MNMSTMKRRLIVLSAFSALAFSTAYTPHAQAQAKEVVIAYQDMVVPWRYAQASGEVERATGYKVTYRKLGSGADVIRALASGSVQLGEAGSSPIAAGLSQGVDLSLFWILDNINDAEALVARDGSGVTSVKQLTGKKVGVTFVSTSHFHTLVALQSAGVNPSDVKIVNLRPPEIAAAWERGDIDAAYVWDPALAQIKQSGHVLITSGELSKQGKPTFDGIAVDRKWGEANADFMAKFVKVIASADAAYRQNQGAWTAGSPQVKSIVKMIGGKPEDVPGALSLYAYPSAEQQASAEWLGGGKDSRAAKALKDTADFLKGQQKINAVKADYTPFVTSRYVDAALKLK